MSSPPPRTIIGILAALCLLLGAERFRLQRNLTRLEEQAFGAQEVAPRRALARVEGYQSGGWPDDPRLHRALRWALAFSNGGCADIEESALLQSFSPSALELVTTTELRAECMQRLEQFGPFHMQGTIKASASEESTTNILRVIVASRFGADTVLELEFDEGASPRLKGLVFRSLSESDVGLALSDVSLAPAGSCISGAQSSNCP